MKYFLVVIRIVIGGMFVLAGIGKLFGPEPFLAMMEGANMFMIPLFFWAATALEIIGGGALITGFRSKWAAIALMGFTAVVSVIIHDFWTMEGTEAESQMFFFLKNIVIIGLLFLVIKFGSGRFAFENRKKKTAKKG